MEIVVGAVVEGTIKTIKDFGAFVALPGGRQGLVHISEVANAYVTNVRDFLEEGQTVKVKVVGIDDAGRINLSIKKALPPPPRQQNNGFRGRPGGQPRQDRQDRQDQRSGGPRNAASSRQNGPREPREFREPREPRVQAAPQAPGPADFEARLKQFMQSSNSKLSGMGMSEKRSSRRSGHR